MSIIRHFREPNDVRDNYTQQKQVPRFTRKQWLNPKWRENTEPLELKSVTLCQKQENNSASSYTQQYNRST